MNDKSSLFLFILCSSPLLIAPLDPPFMSCPSTYLCSSFRLFSSLSTVTMFLSMLLSLVSRLPWTSRYLDLGKKTSPRERVQKVKNRSRLIAPLPFSFTFSFRASHVIPPSPSFSSSFSSKTSPSSSSMRKSLSKTSLMTGLYT